MCRISEITVLGKVAARAGSLRNCASFVLWTSIIGLPQVYACLAKKLIDLENCASISPHGRDGRADLGSCTDKKQVDRESLCAFLDFTLDSTDYSCVHHVWYC